MEAMVDVRNNQERSRYEIFLDGQPNRALMAYRVDGDTVITPHTEIDPAHGGSGVRHTARRGCARRHPGPGDVRAPAVLVRAALHLDPSRVPGSGEGVLGEAGPRHLAVHPPGGVRCVAGRRGRPARRRSQGGQHGNAEGALTVVVTGIALVGVIEGLDEPLDRPQVAVKFAVGAGDRAAVLGEPGAAPGATGSVQRDSAADPRGPRASPSSGSRPPSAERAEMAPREGENRPVEGQNVRSRGQETLRSRGQECRSKGQERRSSGQECRSQSERRSSGHGKLGSRGP